MIYLTTKLNNLIWLCFLFHYSFFFSLTSTHILSIFINENELVARALHTIWTKIEKDLYFDLCHRSRDRRGIGSCWILGHRIPNKLKPKPNTHTHICESFESTNHRWRCACVLACYIQWTKSNNKRNNKICKEKPNKKLHLMCWSNKTTLLCNSLFITCVSLK